MSCCHFMFCLTWTLHPTRMCVPLFCTTDVLIFVGALPSSRNFVGPQDPSAPLPMLYWDWNWVWIFVGVQFWGNCVSNCSGNEGNGWWLNLDSVFLQILCRIIDWVPVPQLPHWWEVCPWWGKIGEVRTHAYTRQGERLLHNCTVGKLHSTT